MESDHLIVDGGTDNIPVEKTQYKKLLFGNLVVFILTLADTIYEPVSSQYLYRRISQDVFNSSHVNSHNNACYVNKTDPDYILQEEAQSQAAGKQMQFSILLSSLGIISNIMLGVYSDSVGRKVLFLVPLTGHLVRFILTTVIIHWNLDINFFFLSNGLDGLTGGTYGIIMAIFAYTADNTPPTGSRTIWVAIAEAPYYIAAASTSIATGYFIQDTGFFYPALTASILCFIDIILVILFLPKSPYINRQEDGTCITPLAGIKRVFGFYVFDGTCITRVCFIVALLSFVFNIGLPMSSSVDTLFLLNEPFCWSPEKLGYYTSVSALLGPLVAIPFTKALQFCLRDEVIGIITTFSSVTADIIHSMASTDVMMYIVVAVSSFSGTISGITRAILSRMVPHHRQGSLFASIAVIEAVCTLVGSPIFSSIYQTTVSFWRGLVYISLAASHVIAAALLLLYIFVSRRLEDAPAVLATSVQATQGDSEDEDD